jgi:hypothetical protein
MAVEKWEPSSLNHGKFVICRWAVESSDGRIAPITRSHDGRGELLDLAGAQSESASFRGGDALTKPGHTLRRATWNRLPAAAQSRVRMVELAQEGVSRLLGTGGRATLVFEQLPGHQGFARSGVRFHRSRGTGQD